MHRVWEILIVLLGVAVSFFVSATVPQATIQRDAGAAVVALLLLVAAVLVWEGRRQVSRIRLRWPFVLRPQAGSIGGRRSDELALAKVSDQPDGDLADLRMEVAALMMTPIEYVPKIRHKAALISANFKLTAPERSLLITWAELALTGGDLDYDTQLVSEVPGQVPRAGSMHYELSCWDKNAYPKKQLMGAITAPEREDLLRLAAAHRTMIAQLRAS